MSIKLGTLLLCFVVGLYAVSSFAQEEHSAVSTPNAEAIKTASDILAKGGNAVDAGAAALLVLCVNDTKNVALAGYGGSLIIYSAKDKKVYAVDFDSRLPENYDVSVRTELNAYRGYKAVGPPGIVSGIHKALEKFGTLWKEVSQHAIHLAENGIPVTYGLEDDLKDFVKVSDPDSIKAYLPDGVPTVGTVFKQKDLAGVIRKIGEEGPDGFYKGELAKRIAEQFHRPNFLFDYADVPIPKEFQGQSLRPLLEGKKNDWRKAWFYEYFAENNKTRSC